MITLKANEKVFFIAESAFATFEAGDQVGWCYRTIEEANADMQRQRDMLHADNLKDCADNDEVLDYTTEDELTNPKDLIVRAGIVMGEA